MEDEAPSGVGGDDSPSLRLIQVLRTYCHGLEPGGMTDLRYSISTGHYPWLRSELAAMLCGPDPSGTWWQETVADDYAGPPVADPQSAQQRLWRALFPTEPYPQDQPSA